MDSSIQSNLLITKTVDIQMDENNPEKIIKFGKCLNRDELDQLSSLLLEFKDIFAWTYLDMSGIDSKIDTHNIILKPNMKLVKKKI